MCIWSWYQPKSPLCTWPAWLTIVSRQHCAQRGCCQFAGGCSACHDGARTECHPRATHAGGASGNLDEVQNPKILDFLQQPRGKAMRRGALSSEAPAYLPESATFEEMLDLVVSQSAHRAYLVDEESKPVAVATLTDLLYAMAGERATGRPLGDT